MNDPKILEAERTGGDSPLVANYCLCEKEIPPDKTICQECRDADENRKEAESKEW